MTVELQIWQMILYGWAAVAVIQVILWILQRITRDAGITDVGWAFGVALLALWYALADSGEPVRRILALCLGGFWALRLALYILVDRVIGGEEDGRYTMLRESWGSSAQAKLFGFFQLQAFWSVLFSIPILAAMRNPSPNWTPWDAVGIGIWFVAVLGESIADRQLARWRRNPGNRGKTCRAGLWRYSRHPNYFFEWLHWWAYVPLAFGSPWVWAALAGPLVMIVFLYKITGIPYTEKRALLSRGDDYRRYQETTSAFIPWFPKEKQP